MMDSGNWGKQYSMENIIDCEYNMDNGYVEVYYSDGNVLRLKCEEIEAGLCTTEQSLAKLHKLLGSKPIEYVVMALSGEMQAYCDIETDMVKGMFGTIVQGYLKQGYSKAMVEALAREFFRYESWGKYDGYREKSNGAVMHEDFDRNRTLRNGYGSKGFGGLDMRFGADERE